MNTQWGDAEEKKLQGIPHLAQLVYLRCLRRFMDYKTGVVGEARKISWLQMAETTEVIRDARSTERDYRATDKELRVAIEQLIRAELVVRLPKRNPANRFEEQRYRLPLAVLDTKPPPDKPGSGGGSQDAGTVCPQYEGQMRGKATGANEGQELSDCFFTSTTQQQDVSGANEGQGDRGNHQGSGTTVLNYTGETELSDEQLSRVPKTPGQWKELLINAFKFDFHNHHEFGPGVMSMFRQWVQWGVSIEEFVMVTEIVGNKLGRRPDTPAYYRNFVESIVRERPTSKLPEPRGQQHGKSEQTNSSKPLSAREQAEQDLRKPSPGRGRVFEHKI